MSNPNDPKQKAMWGGRFESGPSEAFQAFSQSLDFDKRLYVEDIQGSQAYCRALGRAGLLKDQEVIQLEDGLGTLLQRIQSGEVKIAGAAEDIHSFVEGQLAELIGSELAGKLHTGRSRNDQVMTGLRLYLLNALWDLDGHLSGLVQALCGRAEREIDAILPGYTHLQQALPVRWSHFLLAYCFHFLRDRDRLKGLMSRVDASPLGSGALNGTPFAIDREILASELGFSKITENSMDSVGSRDIVIEFHSFAAITASALSRLCEDLILYSSREFGFVTLSDVVTTGSSIMPQKKNPDALELMRGKTGRIYGNLMNALTLVKGLPQAYNRDLQEDKEPLFDSIDTLKGCLALMMEVVSTLQIRKDRMQEALSDDLLATDLAFALVKAGMPFRHAHEVVGKLVREGERKGMSWLNLSPGTWKTIDPLLGKIDRDALTFEKSVEARNQPGGTSREAVIRQIEQVKGRLP